MTVIDYLKPLSVAELSRLYGLVGITARDGLRRAEPGATELLDQPDSAILATMMVNPILIELPLVVIEKGARLSAAGAYPRILWTKPGLC